MNQENRMNHNEGKDICGEEKQEWGIYEFWKPDAR